MGRFGISISSEAQEELEAFCEAVGASRSEVLDQLITEYLGFMARDMVEAVKGLYAGVDEDQDEEEDLQEDEDEEDEG